jgi:outer membrane protein OmpA-like peptidoglycan-associated protein
MRRSFLACLVSIALFAPAFARAQEPAPAAAEAGAGDCVGKARLRGLEFSHAGTELDAADAVILDLVADAIKQNCTGKTITIEGHTSISGSAEYNQKLSLNRAEAVRDYLISGGVPPDQLKVVGFGASRPLTDDPSPAAQKVNRRVTLVAS